MLKVYYFNCPTNIAKNPQLLKAVRSFLSNFFRNRLLFAKLRNEIGEINQKNTAFTRFVAK